MHYGPCWPTDLRFFFVLETFSPLRIGAHRDWHSDCGTKEPDRFNHSQLGILQDNRSNDVISEMRANSFLL